MSASRPAFGCGWGRWARAGTVVAAPAGGGFELALKTDALWMRVSSDAAGGLPGARADARRVRLVLDASRVVETAGGATLTPRFEAGDSP